MRRSLLLIVSLAFCASAGCQTVTPYKWVIDTLERNSSTLQMLAQRLEADRSAATAGSLLENPSLEVALYAARPATAGPRHDIRLSQQFDFPLAYIHRHRIRKLQADMAQSDYESHRRDFLLEAQQVCSDLVYYNAYVKLYTHCAVSMRQVVAIYDKRLREGDCSILDYNRVQTELAAVENKLRMAETERDLMRDNLRMLAGGQELAFVQDTFAAIPLPSSLDDWLSDIHATAPFLQFMRRQADISGERVSLSRCNWLPALSVGYAAEMTPDESYHGIALGLSLPLWERRGTVRQARLRQQADEAAYNDALLRLDNHLRGLYAKARTMQTSLRNLSAALQSYNSGHLLLKSLEAGEITLENYLQSIEFYHDTEIDILELEHSLERTTLELLYYCEP